MSSTLSRDHDDLRRQNEESPRILKLVCAAHEFQSRLFSAIRDEISRTEDEGWRSSQVFMKSLKSHEPWPVEQYEEYDAQRRVLLSQLKIARTTVDTLPAPIAIADWKGDLPDCSAVDLRYDCSAWAEAVCTEFNLCRSLIHARNSKYYSLDVMDRTVHPEWAKRAIDLFEYFWLHPSSNSEEQLPSSTSMSIADFPTHFDSNSGMMKAVAALGDSRSDLRSDVSDDGMGAAVAQLSRSDPELPRGSTQLSFPHVLRRIWTWVS
ncbi:hypothetical protein M231_07958 [Tremella mesenterica]|uniref:Uncharacterized protein n=1 Tax=Tremella mesenterica TaxID=5217 RepID=A0A4V1M2W4_TREME|nr:hypothetical protein M231_07958 [Tremella mesenterica]